MVAPPVFEHILLDAGRQQRRLREITAKEKPSDPAPRTPQDRNHTRNHNHRHRPGALSIVRMLKRLFWAAYQRGVNLDLGHAVRPRLRVGLENCQPGRR
jgi:hypothetical protein